MKWGSSKGGLCSYGPIVRSSTTAKSSPRISRSTPCPSSLVGGFSAKPTERVTAALISCLVEADAKPASLDSTDEEAGVVAGARDGFALLAALVLCVNDGCPCGTLEPEVELEPAFGKV